MEGEEGKRKRVRGGKREMGEWTERKERDEDIAQCPHPQVWIAIGNG